MGWYFSIARRSSSIPHLWRVLLACLVLPSMMGIAICQHSILVNSAEVYIYHIEMLLPIQQSVRDTAPVLRPYSMDGSQMVAMSGSKGHAQVCMVTQENTVLEHSLGIESITATLTISSMGGAIPALGKLVPTEAVFLPSLRISYYASSPRIDRSTFYQLSP